MSPGQEPVDQVSGERGTTSITRVLSAQSRASNILAVGLMSLLGLGALTWYYATTLARQGKAKESAQAASVKRAQGDQPLPSLGRIEQPGAVNVSNAAAKSADPQDPLPLSQDRILMDTPAQGAGAGGNAPPSKTPEQLALERQLSGAVFAPHGMLSGSSAAYLGGAAGDTASMPGGSGAGGASIGAASGVSAAGGGGAGGGANGGAGVAGAGEAPGVAGASGLAASPSSAGLSAAAGTLGAAGASGYAGASAATGAPGGAEGRELGALLRPTATTAVRAQVLPAQRLLLPKGAFIDCTLETAIDSTLPGMTTCVMATDTFGVDGKVVLLERGTKLIGETRGQVQQGAARIFVVWTEARTPTGVVVPLDSPGADELGRAGLPGEVDTHFWQRFGAAMLVSIIDGAVQTGIQSSRGGSGTIIVNPTASQEVMTEILKNTISIPPTVVKRNGDRIQVLVARDLDFRSVYELRSVSTGR